MTTSNEIEDINQAILALWNKSSEEQTLNRLPALCSYPNLKSAKVLFIGCNPSFPNKDKKNKIYNFKDVCQENIDAAKADHEKSKTNYSFFQKYHLLTKAIGFGESDWECVDLFFIRETSQTNIEKMVFVNGKKVTLADENEDSQVGYLKGLRVGNLNAFGKAQLDYSTRLIELARPRIILVANALASQVLCERYQTAICDKTGSHHILIDTRRVPILYSSMLSGQRAIDRFTFQRLAWHMKKIIENTDCPI